jgi:DNA-binding transcriptional ArsR family regulator
MGRVEGDADIAKVGALVADPGRARILLALADGRALPATVLADEAGVSASTASAHLAKLVAGGLLDAERDGRHKYFRVAGPDVAELMEALARLSPATTVRSLRQSSNAQAIRFARTCYDHLAGVLGTSLMDAMLERELLSDDDELVDYRLTDRGVTELGAFGIELAPLRARRRPLIRGCVDWSERRHHLAGGLGAAVTDRMFQLGWLERARRSRAVHVTEAGGRGLRETFGVELAALAA